MEALFFILAGLILLAGGVYEYRKNVRLWRERTDPVPSGGLGKGDIVERPNGLRVRLTQAVTSEVDGRLLYWRAVDDHGALYNIDTHPTDWRLAR